MIFLFIYIMKTKKRLIMIRLRKESEVADVIAQILKAIQHCHSLGIIHRDLKLENVLFKDQVSNTIQIIDFGLSRIATERYGYLSSFLRPFMSKKAFERTLATTCGTSFYMAPEGILSVCVFLFLFSTNNKP